MAVLFSFRSEKLYYNLFRFYFVLVHDNTVTLGEQAVWLDHLPPGMGDA